MILKIEEVRTENLRKLLNKYGYPKLMELTQKSQSQICQWVRNTMTSAGRKSFISEKSCRSLEVMLQLPDRWFDSPHGESTTVPSAAGAAQKPSDDNVVPLYERPEWNDAGQPTEALDWFLCPIPHGPRTFALVVRDDSMYKPEHKHNLTTGDVVFIDPDLEPKDGDYVLATSTDFKRTSIKQFKVQGSDTYLHTPNPEWQKQWIEIDETITIRGVITGKVTRIR